MGTDFALIGYESKGSENLSLRLLAGAIHDAGFRADVVTAKNIGLGHEAVKRAVRLKPAVLGFSLQDSENALHILALSLLARKYGYKGYIVAGGPFATLQPDWVLNKAKAIDGIIRHDGEGPVVALLEALRTGSDLQSVPSLVTREFSNIVNIKDSAPQWRPLRDKRPKIMGVATADIIAGRGCNDRCEYCTHAAVANLAVRECKEAGVTASELRKSGLGGIRRRPLSDLVDEMSSLYHNDDVRYFQFIDENPVPKGEAAAITWAQNLKSMFDREGMDKVGLGFMTRSDTLTPASVDALVELGLVRTLTGMESGSSDGLNGVGRKGDPVRGRRGLNLLADSGILTMFNAQILNPSSTIQSIRKELGFLSTVSGAMFDTVQVRPSTGTALHEKMIAAGRIRGGSLIPSFDIKDPAVDRFASLMARLQTKVLGRYTPTFQVNDLLFSALLHERNNGSNAATTRVINNLRSLAESINRARVSTLISLLEVAEQNDNSDLAMEEASELFNDIVGELTIEASGLKKLGGTGLEFATQYRNLAAAAALVFAVSLTPACYNAETDFVDTDTSSDADSDSDTDTDTDTDTDSDTDTETTSDTETTTDECTNDETWQEQSDLEGLVWDNCGFWDGSYYFSVVVTLDSEGNFQSVQLGYVDGGEPWVEEVIECYEELLEDEVFPCLAGEEIWIYPGIDGDYEYN